MLVIESPKIDKGLSIAGTVPPVLAGAFDPVVVLGLVVVAVEDPPLLFAGLGIVVVGPPTADAAALNTLLGVVPFISATPSSPFLATPVAPASEDAARYPALSGCGVSAFRRYVP